MIQKIAFIAHPIRDLDKAKSFFGDVLGLEPGGDTGDRWAEFTTPDGRTIALDTYSPELSDSPAPYVALETDDIEAEVQRLRDQGVRIARDVWPNQDKEGRELCRMAVLLDPEGNVFLLHQIADWRKE